MGIIIETEKLISIKKITFIVIIIIIKIEINLTREIKAKIQKIPLIEKKMKIQGSFQL